MRWGLVVLWLALLAACARPGTPAIVVPPHPAGTLTFDAKEVDVGVDWEEGPADASAPTASASLTASDGTGLRLVRFDARAVLYGPLAFTEIHLEFDNPEDRTREGTFAVTLPESAALSRFAMRVGAELREGEVVEKDTARATYERFLHKNVDPALLEKTRGNVFRARVFPIGPRAKKEIVLSYTEELPRPRQPYRLGLRGLPSVEQLDVQLLVPAQKKAFVLHRKNLAPAHDFAFTPPAEAAGVVRSGRFAVARVSAAAREERPSPAGAVAVLVDTSASRAPTFEADVAKAAEVVAALGARSVQIACFDQEIVPVASFAEAARRRPGGASDLQGALRWLARSGATRGVLVTDGVPSAGALEPGELGREALATGLERIDALVFGARREERGLRAITGAGLYREGAVLDAASLSATAMARRLLVEARATVPITGDAGGFVWPPRIGEQKDALVFVEAGSGEPRLAVDGKPRALVAEEAPEPLVARAVAAARIRALVDERNAPGTTKARAEELRRRIVELSTEHRVVSDFTSMLVLERDADYERFRIPQRARENVLAVTSRGVVNLPRGGRPPAEESPSSPLLDFDARESSRGVDTDNDGIPDDQDQCPTEPETYNGIDDEDGCPDRGRVVIESSNIVILEQIHFRTGSSAVLPEASPILDATAAVLEHHPEVLLLELRGHTDGRGSAESNRAISEARARAVLEELVKRGVPRSRLTYKGVGTAEPIAPLAGTPEDAARNRRVEFKIVRWKDRVVGKGATPAPPLEGELDAVTKLVDAGRTGDALARAIAWQSRAPDDLLARVAEGKALEASGNWAEAARAYGSLLDLAARPEHERAAAAFLEALAPRHPRALDLAIGAYRHAAAERPELVSSHRQLAFALAHAGRLDEAFDAALRGLEVVADDPRDPRRQAGALYLLRDDAGVLAAALAARRPADVAAIQARLEKAGGAGGKGASTRVVLTWETDESDLDLVVQDATGVEIAVAHDATLGFGPEHIVETRRLPLGYTLKVAQHRRGPAGFAIGKVSVLEHDGHGALRFDDRPFVVMSERAAVSLGKL